jgi:hypothetical protein
MSAFEVDDTYSAERFLTRCGISRMDESFNSLFKEISDLIAERDRLKKAIDFIGVAESCWELFPVGPSYVTYGPDGNAVIEYVLPWMFLGGRGNTFLEAVEDEMSKRKS